MNRDEIAPPKIAGDFLTIYTSHAQVPRTPESLFFFAVLQDGCGWATRVAAGNSKGSRRKKELIEEARRWVNDMDDLWFCSFRNCCFVLGIEPDYLRRQLHALILEKENLYGYQGEVRSRRFRVPR